jgi:hypothetical protein
MSRIEIKIKHHPEIETFKEHFLFIDGNFIDGVSVGENYFFEARPYNYYVISWNKENSSSLVSLTLNEFFVVEVGLLTILHWDKWESLEVSVGFRKGIDTQDILFETEFKPDLLNWKSLYSYNDYYEKFAEIWNHKYQEELLNERVDNKFKPTLKFSSNNLPVEDEIKSELKKVFVIHQAVLEQLREEGFSNQLITSFNFPEEIKTPCEQYLLYFAQFLRDLGINATSNLKEEAGKVLFSVTPTDDNEALDKIRQALAVYLKLPESPISDIEYSENFALMRLQQQVRNLQHSQQMAKTEILSAQFALSLAQQNIDNQDRIIIRQNSLIENQDKVIEKITSKSIMIDSVEKKEVKEEYEEIYEGMRSGESKWLRELTGIGLNPAKFIKAAVKNTLGKDDGNKSVLGLDEESSNKD